MQVPVSSSAGGPGTAKFPADMVSKYIAAAEQSTGGLAATSDMLTMQRYNCSVLAGQGALAQGKIGSEPFAPLAKALQLQEVSLTSNPSQLAALRGAACRRREGSASDGSAKSRTCNEKTHGSAAHSSGQPAERNGMDAKTLPELWDWIEDVMAQQQAAEPHRLVRLGRARKFWPQIISRDDPSSRCSWPDNTWKHAGCQAAGRAVCHHTTASGS